MIDLALQGLALICVLGAVAAAVCAIVSRSLFVTAVGVFAAGACASAAALLLKGGEAALALALFAAGWAPVLLLAAMLLSARSSKAARRGPPWFTIAAATLAVAALAFVLPDLPARSAVAPVGAGVGLWAAVLAVVGAAACTGLIGYGERGAIAHHAERRG
ncbi:MAG: hypothetical protein AB7O98_07115 [Hyphomonadaceae bacterium]